MKGIQVVTSQNPWRRRFLCVIYFIMMVSLGLGFHFGGKGLSCLGSWTINTALNAADGLLGSFASFEIRDLVRNILSD